MNGPSLNLTDRRARTPRHIPVIAQERPFPSGVAEATKTTLSGRSDWFNERAVGILALREVLAQIHAEDY
jgi:hypothetical protein